MRRYRLLISVILELVGLVWIGQGSGVIAGSAMSGSPFWAVAGIVLVLAGLVISAMGPFRRLRAMRRRPDVRPETRGATPSDTAR